MIFSFYSFSVDPTSFVLRAPERDEVSTQSLQTYEEPANRVGFGNKSGKPGEREEGKSLVGKKFILSYGRLELNRRIEQDVVLNNLFLFTCLFFSFPFRVYRLYA